MLIIDDENQGPEIRDQESGIRDYNDFKTHISMGFTVHYSLFAVIYQLKTNKQTNKHEKQQHTTTT